MVEKIAGIAAREVPGIHALGGGFTRTMGAMRDRVPGGHAGRGVKVEVGEKQTAIDRQVVVEYEVSIREAAAEVRENVALGECPPGPLASRSGRNTYPLSPSRETGRRRGLPGLPPHERDAVDQGRVCVTSLTLAAVVTTLNGTFPLQIR
ncbi:Asp23/Gls24 family envelope stress response protein [Streptomyces umbrinus]|uniref:Asp23/Gls24 family envelope stress response protein n=1 Tax=Streptomyces umbrinus TaxID=67370 RepID=UPI003F4D90DD